MKAASRPQYYRIRRIVHMVRNRTQTGYLANSLRARLTEELRDGLQAQGLEAVYRL
jgi:hypothetical protein